MDKQKQIEEMAKVLEFCCNGENIENCNSDRSCDSCRAKYLYDAGYRKIPENAVVLTDEEYERWQGQTISFGKIRKEAIVNFMKDLTHFIGHMKPSEYSIVEAILEIERKAYEIAEKFNVKLNDVIKEEN